MDYIKYIRLAAAVVNLTMIGQARAETEGAGDAFSAHVPAQVMQGAAVVSDTGAEHYLALTGQHVSLPSATAMAAGAASEAPVQSLASLPISFQGGTAAFVQQQSSERWASAHPSRVRLAQTKAAVH